MKTCTGCGRARDLSEFAFRDLASGRRRTDCKDCSRRYHRAHYARNKPYYSEQARIRHPRHRAELRARLLAYLAAHPCIDCGEADVRVLDFDHRDPAMVSWLNSRRDT